MFFFIEIGKYDLTSKAPGELQIYLNFNESLHQNITTNINICNTCDSQKHNLEHKKKVILLRKMQETYSKEQMHITIFFSPGKYNYLPSSTERICLTKGVLGKSGTYFEIFDRYSNHLEIA